jgi:hypothetical protein
MRTLHSYSFQKFVPLVLVCSLLAVPLQAQSPSQKTTGPLVVYSLAASGSEVVAGTNQSIRFSTDNGDHWYTGGGPVQAIITSSIIVDSIYYAAERGAGNVYRFTNRGIHGEYLGNLAWWYGYGPTCLAAIGQSLFVGTDGSGFYRRSDTSSSWTYLHPPGTGGWFSYFSSLAELETDIFAGSLGGLIRSTDYGNTWTISGGYLPDPHVTCLGTTPGTLWIGVYNFGLYRSTDHGVTCHGVVFPGGVPNFIVTSGNRIFVGGNDPKYTSPFNNSVFQSTDDGASWSPIGPPGVGVSCVACSPSALYFGTPDGVLRSTNNGSTWTTLNPLTGIPANASPIPDGFRLEQNYPNPFNPSTRIKYTVGGVRGQGPGTGEAGAGGSGLGTGKTSLIVYDLLGREVAVLVNERKAPGSYEVRFEGSGLPGGVYFYRLQSGKATETRKALLLK